MRFHESPVRVRVPATSANLGPGFDTFGLALSRYDEVTAGLIGSGVQIVVEGEGSAEVALDERHLVLLAMRAALDRLGGQPSGLRLECRNRIPHGRGLGSSAAAIVAGIELARSLVVDGRESLDDEAALALANEIEGHPDNVAACLLGGMTVAWTQDGIGRATRFDPVGVSPVLFIPQDQSATEVARAALPGAVPHADAAFNVSRAALLVLAMTGRPQLLLTATEDRLHQQYRQASMPASAALMHRLREAGIAAVVSGAGSTVLALVAGGAQQSVEIIRAESLTPVGWECAALSVAEGASCL